MPIQRCRSRDPVVCKVRCKAVAIEIKRGKNPTLRLMPCFLSKRGLVCSSHFLQAPWPTSFCLLVVLRENQALQIPPSLFWNKDALHGIFVIPQTHGILMAGVMVLGGGAFGRRLGHEGTVS